jgi:hypothetical protein
MKMLGDILLSVTLGILLSWCWVVVAEEQNYNGIFIGAVGVCIVFTTPGIMLRWIYKEELEAEKSGRSEE